MDCDVACMHLLLPAPVWCVQALDLVADIMAVNHHLTGMHLNIAAVFSLPFAD